MHTLLSSGSNARGQLGNASTDDSHFFQRCSFDGYPPFHLPTQTTRVVDLVTGANHTILLLELSDGPGCKREIWGAGDGTKGQLGCFGSQSTENPLQTSSVFRKIELPLLEAGLEDHSFKFIGATWETSYIVLSCDGKDDVVLSMGSDDYGDLGIASLQSNRVFNIVDFEHLFDKSGSTLKGDRFIVNSLTSGQRHIILDLRIMFCGKPSAEEIVVGWGMSRHGQLGVASPSIQKPPSLMSTPQVVSVSRPLDPIIATALGLHHSIFLHASGHLTSLGSDRKGQLQLVPNVECAKDVKCTWNGTYCIVPDGSAWSLLSSGSNTHGQLGHEGSAGRVVFPNTVNATTDTSVQIACGSEHVLALIQSRDAIPTSQIWGWGWNEHGNLGLGNTEDVRLPVRVWPLGEGISVDVYGVWGGCGTSWIYCEHRESFLCLESKLSVGQFSCAFLSAADLVHP